ncbi:MalY/PatB family protein [Falsirhodobacter xinxiangensis]|uniref:MalY/PatB family protein n=1 Tax=Falsirhodobacter xinxiangensis TaxID=2530049 RepID=UPI0010AAE51C|nr:MalY/PatB family protein [Rhodobacter xinxiangensis]
MNFDERIDRIGTHCDKWDMMETLFDVPRGKGLAMWVADMEFRPPASVQRALEEMVAHGVYGYFGDDADYLAAICWWMKNRHGWEVDPKAIFTTHGIVNGVALAIEAFSEVGDGVVLTTPVYHAFARITKAAGREVVECQLALNGGRYEMDFDAWDAQMTGREAIFILCSPHNPGGRVWTQSELRGVADFCKRHDLILISDEIHHDLVLPGATHIAMPLAAPDIEDRLVMMTATTKTFNLAGGHIGNVIVPDPDLRRKFRARIQAQGISPNSFAVAMATAAYTPEGAEWVDALMAYLDRNRRLFDETIASIPGLVSMPLEATYLAWVDFSGTGLTLQQMLDRVERQAGIATSYGNIFGKGGETYLRFNIGAPRAQIEDACARLRDVFSDLQ